MGIFSTSTPFDEQLDKATNELNTETDWGLILSLCDKITVTSNGPAIFGPALLLKLNNKVPHVSMQAITVLDACVSNCGKDFHKMLSSPAFTEGLRDFLNRYKNPTVTRRLRYFIKKWSDEFKDDTSMSKFVAFYYNLRGQGMEFPETEDESSSKRQVEVSSNPDAVSSQQEADDIAKAIEASLKEEQQRKGPTTSSVAPTSSLYPSVLGGGGVNSLPGSSTTGASNRSMVTRKVKALYDFEAAEDNELTFKTGDIISILDDGDANWWKGEGSNGSGLFPANFVTSDLSSGIEEEEKNVKESAVKFNETLEVKEVNQNEPVLEINEDLIDQTLATLQSTDPETTATDPEELTRDEESCLQMGKLIDSQLEDIDRKHFELTMLNEKILDALKMYDNLMKQAPLYPSHHRYGPMTLPNQPSLMSGYPSTHPYSAAPYMSHQPVHHPGASQQMIPPPHDPNLGYNPMYHGAPPPSGYAAPMASGSMHSFEQQQQQQQLPSDAQNATFPSSLPQASLQSYGASMTYGDSTNPPMMSQYQSQLGSIQPVNYSTNQVASQPLI